MYYDYNYYKENFSRKFLALLDYVYSDLPKKKRKGRFLDAYEEAYYSSINSTMRSWCAPSSPNTPNLDSLMNICNLYNVDIDYFLTDQEVLRKAEDNAAKVTGLRYETIDRITRYPDNLKQILDMLSCPSAFVDNDDLPEYTFRTTTDLLSQILLAIDIDVGFSRHTELHIKDEAVGLQVNAYEEEEVTPMIHASTTIKISNIIDQIREIKQDNRLPEFVYEEIVKKKFELLQSGLSQQEVDLEIDKLRPNIISEIKDKIS